MKEISFEFKIPDLCFSEEWKKRIRIILSLVFTVGAFVAWQNFNFTLPGTLILIYFGLAFIWMLDSRISAGLALFFLVCCPILLAFNNEELAETMAVYAYYFLVITVAGEINSLIWDKKNLKQRLMRGVHNSSRQPKRKVV